MHFRTPPVVIDDSSWKNAAESFTVALTLTFEGYESAMVPKNCRVTETFTNARLYLPEHVFLATKLAWQNSPDLGFTEQYVMDKALFE